MSETAIRYEGREPVTRRVHRRRWVADLNSSSHARDKKLLLREAADAAEQTAPRTRIDIGTHRRHDHPSAYLYPRLESMFDAIQLTDDDRCHCGGYVTGVVV